MLLIDKKRFKSFSIGYEFNHLISGERDEHPPGDKNLLLLFFTIY
jgi:hypothetical protein